MNLLVQYGARNLLIGVARSSSRQTELAWSPDFLRICSEVGTRSLNKARSKALLILRAFELFEEMECSNRNGLSLPILDLTQLHRL
jgi:hypothetical protein